MEKLTEDYNDSYCLKKCHPNNDCFCDGGGCPIDNCGEVIEALNKLGEYEKAEEQGLLVRLPAATETKMYVITSYLNHFRDYNDGKAFQRWKYEHRIKEIEFNSNLKDAIGKTIFFTSEEAEKKLEEMKNER